MHSRAEAGKDELALPCSAVPSNSVPLSAWGRLDLGASLTASRLAPPPCGSEQALASLVPCLPIIGVFPVHRWAVRCLSESAPKQPGSSPIKALPFSKAFLVLQTALPRFAGDGGEERGSLSSRLRSLAQALLPTADAGVFNWGQVYG